MSILGNFFIAIAGIVALFFWATNFKVPVGFHEPWKLKQLFIVARLWFRLRAIFTYFGYEHLLPFLASRNEMPASIQKAEKILAGVRCVVYRPARVTGDLPALVFYHGGGFVMGSPELHEATTNTFVQDLGIVIISVDYRLAPEHPYPAPFEDCHKVAEYVMNNAALLKVDPNQISLGGDSAGGNFAAAVSTKLRDEGKGNKIKMQLLLYPVLQSLDFQMSSYEANQGDGALPRKLMVDFWRLYILEKYSSADLVDVMIKNSHVSEDERQEFIRLCGNSHLLTKQKATFDHQAWEKFKSVMNDPYLNPLVARDLKGMPPTVIVSAEQDVLRDESFLYAQRLKEDGIQVIHHHLKSSLHGIFSFRDMFPVDFQRAYDQVLPDIKKLIKMNK